MELQTDDVTLHYLEDGDPQAPPVLLLHGITQNADTWAWLVPHLADDHRVLRLDFRGHGRSGRTPGAYHFADYVDDAVAVCEQVAGVPCTLIGHSLGGATAVTVAQRRSDLVRATVLEDPPLAMPSAEAVAADADIAPLALLESFRLIRESVPRLQAEAVPPEVLTAMLTAAPTPTGPTFGELLHADAIAAMAAGMLQLDATVLDGVLDGTMEGAFDEAGDIPVPTLLLAADPASPDAVTRPRDIERLAATSPLVESRVMTGAGHLIHDSLAHREPFLAALLEFVNRPR